MSRKHHQFSENPASLQREYNCQLCSASDSIDDMVECDKCDLWFHYTCVGVGSFINEQEFVCASCTNAKSQSPKAQSTSSSTIVASHVTSIHPATKSIVAVSPPSTSSVRVVPTTASNHTLPSIRTDDLPSTTDVTNTVFSSVSMNTQVAAMIKSSTSATVSGPTLDNYYSSSSVPAHQVVNNAKTTLPVSHVKAASYTRSATPAEVPLTCTAGVSQLPNNQLMPITTSDQSKAIAGLPKFAERSVRAGATSKRSSKGSKHSATKRVEIELQKLDEEHQLNQQYLNKKYQLLSLLAEESATDDEVSTNANSKVQSWLKGTRNDIQSQNKPPGLLNPLGIHDEISSTWLGANVNCQQQQQQSQSQNPSYPPKASLQQTFVQSLGSQQRRSEDAIAQPMPGHQEATNNEQSTYHRLEPGPNNNILQKPTEVHQSHSSTQQQQQLSRTITRNQLAARQSGLRELQHFSGNPEEWPLFIATFNRTTELCGFTDEENLGRLQRILQGRALEAVQSLLYHPICVPRIINRLNMMFGRPELILNSLLQKIHSAPAPKLERLETIVQFAVIVQNVCATLDAAGLSAHLNNPSLLQELVDKLPSAVRLNWGIYRATKPFCTLTEFSDWVYKIAEAANRVTIPSASSTSSGNRGSVHSKKEKGFLHTHVGVTSTDNKAACSKPTNELVGRKCLVCEGNCASVEKCDQFVQLKHASKWVVVREHKLCRKCLRRHGRFPCRMNTVCGKNNCSLSHHKLLHNDQKDIVKVPDICSASFPQPQPNNAHTQTSSSIMYRIVPVILHNSKTTVETYAFLDDGSSLTLLDEEVATQLNVEGKPDPLCIKWTANTHRYEDDSKVLDLQISGASGGNKLYPLLAVHTVKSLQLPHQSLDAEKMKNSYDHLRNLPLKSYTDATPRLLIGLNNWKLGLPLKCKEGKMDEPVAAKTRLGWTVHGCCPHDSLQSASSHASFHICECSADGNLILEQLVEEFLSTERFGTSESADILLSSDHQRAMKLLQNHTLRKDGRYETGLLWKYDDIQLPDSFPMAKRRLLCLQQQMRRNPTLAEELHQKIESYVAKGYARKLSQSEIAAGRTSCWYLPIFPVRNVNKPGKLRLVWDAAAKVNGVSLNSVLLKGPDLLTPLMSVIFKFRERRFAICADIQEMYHQVLVRKEDQQFQRFLWFNRNNEMEEYVMLVMTFGATCSPCSAHYVKNKNADEFENDCPRAVKSIRENHYVDDLMDSVETEEEAVSLANNITLIHQQAGFNIRNWISNSTAVIESMQSNPREEVNLNSNAELVTEKVLGMWWCPAADYLTFKVSLQPKNADVLQGTRIPTKREVLQILMRIFDPLGLIANYLMYAKVMLQEVWRTGISWDDPIQEPQYKKWLHWTRILPRLEEVQIPRCYLSRNFIEYPEVQLHVFVDASEDGFAAVAYARASSTNLVECALIGAKTKVSPLKSLSIPRLELQAAVLGVRLARTIVKSHSISFSQQTFWSDSKTVLSWLRSDHRRYRQFVAVRVSEILESTTIPDWRWVPTKINVADEATKWQRTPSFDSSTVWFKGPSFLLSTPESWPKESSTEATMEELKAQFVGLHGTHVQGVFQPERFSDWSRLLRCAAQVLRFISNVRAKKRNESRVIGLLTRDELQNAERALLRQVQRDAFFEDIVNLSSKEKVLRSSPLASLRPHIDEHGILRSRTRIDRYEDRFADVRRPIILPKQHPITNLIVADYHKLYHHQSHETVVNELRQKFYVPQLRAVLGKIRRRCQKCKNDAAKPSPPMMAELPEARLASFSRPLSFVGIDFFGPMTVVNLRRVEKRYGVLLTCLTTRAIHIEIAHSLTTDSCILALRNFMARRGTPIELFSDNGTNFRGAERELREAYKNIDTDQLARAFTTVTTKWNFIPPGSPHMGGSWERLVRSIKTVLYEIAPSRHPSDELLRSMLMEVENIINSRPLTYIPIETESEEAITPNHFLLGSSNGSKPWAEFNEGTEVLRKNWRISQRYAQQFWRRWVCEYLPTITRRTKWFTPVSPIKKGDIVLIVDPSNPRNCWPKGRVLDTKQAADGQVRSATIQTQGGIFERPAVRLAVLDVKENS